MTLSAPATAPAGPHKGHGFSAVTPALMLLLSGSIQAARDIPVSPAGHLGQFNLSDKDYIMGFRFLLDEETTIDRFYFAINGEGSDCVGGRTGSLGSGLVRGKLSDPIEVRKADTYTVHASGTVDVGSAQEGVAVFGLGSRRPYPFTSDCSGCGAQQNRPHLHASPHPWFVPEKKPVAVHHKLRHSNARAGWNTGVAPHLYLLFSVNGVCVRRSGNNGPVFDLHGRMVVDHRKSLKLGKWFCP